MQVEKNKNKERAKSSSSQIQGEKDQFSAKKIALLTELSFFSDKNALGATSKEGAFYWWGM